MGALLDLFGDAFNEVETYSAARPGKGYMERLLGQDHVIALTAVKDGSVVAGLVAYELQKFEQERSEIYVYDLAVATNCRRQGMATTLFQVLKAIAVERGTHVIFVQADQDDEPAIALYSKLGTREDVHHFDIAVR